MSVLSPPVPLSAALPEVVIEVIARHVAAQLVTRSAGHCVRIDSIRPEDGLALVEALRRRVPAGALDVFLLAESRDDADGLTAIPAERAVELRNRKERVLLLLVPIGSGSAASSLDNSFERIDVATLLRAAGEELVAGLGEELRSAVNRVARTLGRSRPVEAWARYVAAVTVDPTWDTAGAMLWAIGMIPDLGGPELVQRLERNVRCVRAIARPRRAVAPVADRLDTAGLQEGTERDRIARYLSRPDVDLSDVQTWAAVLVGSPLAPTFEGWPLAEQRSVDVDRVVVTPFLKEDGALRTGTQLRQQTPGDLPYAEAGPDDPASVKLHWRTEPARPDGIDRWLVEALPPDDLRDADTEPFATQSVKGDKRTATVRIAFDEETLTAGALLMLRLTALDSAGQPVLLTDGSDAVQESQQFAVRWETDIVPGAARRASALSLPLARIAAALDGQDDIDLESPTWDEAGSEFTVRVGGRRTALLATSPALTGLQRRIMADPDPGRAVAWEAAGRLGEVLGAADMTPIPGTLPPALADRRRRLFDRLAAKSPRDIPETLHWDEDLRTEVGAYCQSYRRALDTAPDEQTRVSLLTLDTVMLSVDTAGGASIATVIVLPLHPLRLAWFAGYDAVLNAWATALTHAGTRAERRRTVDADLAGRVTPANLPHVVLSPEPKAYVYTREATLGTGIYLSPENRNPVRPCRRCSTCSAWAAAT